MSDNIPGFDANGQPLDDANAQGGYIYRPPSGDTDPISPIMHTFLNGIAQPESGGKYDVIYGGQRFNDYSRHPHVSVPIPGTNLTSSAAGKYQFIAPTWDVAARGAGVKDFSPQSQDLAAAYWTKTLYKDRTGGDLEADLRDPSKYDRIAGALKDQWPTLNPHNIASAFGTANNVAQNAPAAPPPPQAPTAPINQPDPRAETIRQLTLLNQLTQQQQQAFNNPFATPQTAGIAAAGNWLNKPQPSILSNPALLNLLMRRA